MNRDERYDRKPELPPQVIDSESGIWGPIDAESGGTWIAHREDGYWGALLNGYFEDSDFAPSGRDFKSRGFILTDLLKADDPIAAARDLCHRDYLSFRLLVGSRTEHALFQWNHEEFGKIPFHSTHSDRYFFLSSSSWRQDEVVELRKKCFDKWVRGDRSEIDGVPSFHFSTAPRPESAPMMMRDYSRTMSITRVDVDEASITMDYQRVQEFAEVGAVS